MATSRWRSVLLLCCVFVAVVVAHDNINVDSALKKLDDVMAVAQRELKNTIQASLPSNTKKPPRFASVVSTAGHKSNKTSDKPKEQPSDKKAPDDKQSPKKETPDKDTEKETEDDKVKQCVKNCQPKKKWKKDPSPPSKMRPKHTNSQGDSKMVRLEHGEHPPHQITPEPWVVIDEPGQPDHKGEVKPFVVPKDGYVKAGELRKAFKAGTKLVEPRYLITPHSIQKKRKVVLPKEPFPKLKLPKRKKRKKRPKKRKKKKKKKKKRKKIKRIHLPLLPSTYRSDMPILPASKSPTPLMPSSGVGPTPYARTQLELEALMAGINPPKPGF